MTADFYDDLSDIYHLVYADWHASLTQQGRQLAALMEAQRPGARRVLDLACGIGTQALGLAQCGYSVTGSDLSHQAVARARTEATQRGLELTWAVGDMRDAHRQHGSDFEWVICCDNSLPHLLTDADLLLALQQMHACLAAGGGCLLSVRDYAVEQRGVHLFKPYGTRVEGDVRSALFQIWDFDRPAGDVGGYGDHYDLRLFCVQEKLSTGAVTTRMMRSRYFAVSITHLCDLMHEAGFQDVRRIDNAFHQPVLMGRKPDR